jgi:hypothetical protein
MMVHDAMMKMKFRGRFVVASDGREKHMDCRTSNQGTPNTE